MLYQKLSEIGELATDLKEELALLKKHERVYESKVQLVNLLSSDLKEEGDRSKKTARRLMKKIYKLETKELALDKFEQKELHDVIKNIHKWLTSDKAQAIVELKTLLVAITKLHISLKEQFELAKKHYAEPSEELCDKLARLVAKEGKYLFDAKKANIAEAYQIQKGMNIIEPEDYKMLYHATPIGLHELVRGGLLNKFKAKSGFYMAKSPTVAAEASRLMFKGQPVQIILIKINSQIFKKLIDKNILFQRISEKGNKYYFVRPQEYYLFNEYILNGAVKLSKSGVVNRTL